MAGQNKAHKEELSRRIRVVQEFILDDYSTPDIIQHCRSTWKIEERQAKRYLWAARKFFIEKNNNDIASQAAYYIERKKKLLREMDPLERKTPAGVQAANRVLDSMAKINGLMTKTVKHIGDPDRPIVTTSTVAHTSTVDYSSFSDEFLFTLWQSRKLNNG